jgi:hypothetical protein
VVANDRTIDETRPVCKKCEKSGHKCRGYRLAAVFVNASSAVPLGQDIASHSSSVTVYTNDFSVSVSSCVQYLPPAPRPELSLVAFKPAICLTFLMQNFVWKMYGVGWFEPAARDQIDCLSANAIYALSQVFFGEMHRRKELRLQGGAHYGQVMSKLGVKLAKTKLDELESLMVPVMILLIHAVSSFCKRALRVIQFQKHTAGFTCEC